MENYTNQLYTKVVSAKHRILSFKYAFEGINQALREEPNLKIHLILGILVVIFGFLLQLSIVEWAIILTMIGLVIAVELTNTAVEAVVDAFTSEDHPGAKLAKDISAGAVLVVAMTSAVVGLIVFWPHILNLFILSTH